MSELVREHWRNCIESVNRLVSRRDRVDGFFGIGLALVALSVVYISLLSPNITFGAISLSLTLLSSLHCIIWWKINGRLGRFINWKYEIIRDLEGGFEFKQTTEEKDFLEMEDRTTVLTPSILSRLYCFLIIILELVLSILKLSSVI